MPETRTMQSPYPRGQSFASVPVLFSLPNVQPVIAAANAGIAGSDRTISADERDTSAGRAAQAAAPSADPTLIEAGVDAASQSYQATPIVVMPSVEGGSRADSRWSSWTSQFTNITIGVLLVAVLALGYRNLQQGQSKTVAESDSVGIETLSLNPSSDLNPEPAASIAVRSEVDTVSSPPAARVAAVPMESQRPVELAPQPTTISQPLSQPPSIPQPSSAIESAPPAGKPGIPLLLPPAPQSSSEQGGSRTVAMDEPDRSIPSGPYGSAPASTPVSLTSAKNATPIQLPTAAPAPSVDAGSKALETETPALNTRDIILMRNGQRRSTNPVSTGASSSSDPSIPRVESMPRMNDPRGSDPRVSGPTSGSGSASSSGTVMSGQSYPPIAPQFEPISVNPNGGAKSPNRYQPIGAAASAPPTSTSSSPSRITQPSGPAAGTSPAPAQPYQPISPLLPHPNETLGFDDANP